MTYVLDASALLRYLDGEEGVDRMSEIIKSHVNLESHILVSAVNWGEVLGTLLRRGAAVDAFETMANCAISLLKSFRPRPNVANEQLRSKLRVESPTPTRSESNLPMHPITS